MSYDTLRNTLCNELEEFASKGELNTGDLDVIHKLTDTIKNTYKIEMYEDGGYSRGGEWEADMRGAYGRGNSYANRGQHYVRGHSRHDGRVGRQLIEYTLLYIYGTYRDIHEGEVGKPETGLADRR